MLFDSNKQLAIKRRLRPEKFEVLSGWAGQVTATRNLQTAKDRPLGGLLYVMTEAPGFPCMCTHAAKPRIAVVARIIMKYIKPQMKAANDNDVDDRRAPNLLLESQEQSRAGQPNHHALQTEADARRTAVMERLGWRVVRYSANEVLGNPEGIWAEIDRLMSDDS